MKHRFYPKNSSTIEDVEYEDMVLTVEFVGSGKIYKYDGVPEYVAEAFEHASSRGQFFNQNIRDKYPCEKCF